VLSQLSYSPKKVLGDAVVNVTSWSGDVKKKDGILLYTTVEFLSCFSCIRKTKLFVEMP